MEGRSTQRSLHKANTNFFSLPRELRDEVYRLAMPFSQTLTIRPGQAVCRTNFNTFTSFCGTHAQVRDEAMEIFFSHNEFIWCLLPGQYMMKHSRRYCFCEQAIRQMRNLILRCNVHPQLPLLIVNCRRPGTIYVRWSHFYWPGRYSGHWKPLMGRLMDTVEGFCGGFGQVNDAFGLSDIGGVRQVMTRDLAESEMREYLRKSRK